MSKFFEPISEQSSSGTGVGQAASHSFGPPAAHELEIVVMSRAYGESTLIHSGGGNWLIIDSFEVNIEEARIESQAKASGRVPAAIQYLQEIGVDYEEAVKGVVLTHPHRDHFAGIDSILNRCVKKTSEPDACPPLYVPSVLSKDQWNDYLGSDEINREPSNRPTIEQAFCVAESHSMLMSVNSSSYLQNELRSFRVWSPVMNAVIARGQNDTVFSRRELNLMSILVALETSVVAPEVPEVQALFGADMENDTEFGWQRILESTDFAADTRGAVIKIPHHGAVSSHNPQLYEAFEAGNGYIAIMTASPRAKRQKPTGPTGTPGVDVVKYHQDHATHVIELGPSASVPYDKTAGTADIGWVSARKKIGASTGWSLSAYGERSWYQRDP